MKRPFTFLATLFFLLIAFSATGQELLEKTITVDGLEREYLLYVPAAYDGSEEWPLVLNLHGYLWDGPSQVWISGMNPVADTAHFLIAYPTGQDIDLSAVEGVPSFIPPQGVGWNLGGNLTAYDDIAFLDQMLDEIISGYEVDENRIYSTGFSMGGITSYMLACALSDRIAAVAPVAASLLREEGGLGFPCTPNASVPVFQIHGTDDLVDPYNMPWGTRGVQNSIDFWVDQNGCDSAPLTAELEDIDTTDNSTITSIKYQDCDEDTEVWLYRINDGGHWWPGDSDLPPGFELLGPVNRDINASSEIWNFFNRHSLEPATATPELSSSGLNLRTYPNPVYSQLTLEFNLSEAASVQLTLFNSLGQPAHQLPGKQLSDGRHQFDITTQGLPAGIYYYQLQIGAYQISRTVILKNGL